VAEWWPARMLLTVHDELVYELSVPLEVDIGIADHWADA
jgi:DNA polymerase I-like protein with 3'-5' exonuclease and polymerase domains